MKIIFDYNRTIFNPETGTLYAGVLEMLKILSLNHDLFLVSKNELNREDFFEELGISEYFKKAIFVEEKNEDIFKNLVGDNLNVIVVGDRIKGEIFIGNKLGYTTVWVKQGRFANDLPKNKEEIPNHSIEDIKELMEIIKIYE